MAFLVNKLRRLQFTVNEPQSIVYVQEKHVLFRQTVLQRHFQLGVKTHEPHF